MNIIDGGYNEGYEAVPCFWGIEPGSLVADYLENHSQKLQRGRALDLGCGEGKNAAALTRAGYTVDAIECSNAAIANGKILFSDADIRWQQADVRDIQLPREKYDLVVAYGLYHCLHGTEEISELINRARDATKSGGYHIVCAFNDRSHDLRAHPGFYPTLVPHEWYLRMYADWIIVSATDRILTEIHPHNNISHHHSLTRLMARKPL